MPEKNINLLLIDDDDAIRQTLSIILTQTGYTVRTALDGLTALAAIRESVPDILLSDLFMAGMSGFELLYVVSRRFPTIRVMAMSGAFAGKAIPTGVAAEAFYEKGTNPRYMLKCLERLALPRIPVPVAAQTSTLWVTPSGYDVAGVAYALISCPECLRAFPKTLSGAEELARTECRFCLQSIEYRVVQGPGPAAKPAFVLSLMRSLSGSPSARA
jgi:CheY-like chemotaxis protein